MASVPVAQLEADGEPPLGEQVAAVELAAQAHRIT
jgi:hypothetical protein